MPTSTLTDFVSAHAMLLKVALGCLVGPLLVLLSLALWYMTRTSVSRRRIVSDIEVNVKESTSCASDIFPTPIDSLKSYPSFYFGPGAPVSNPNPNPLPPPLSLWQAADQIVCPYPRPRSNFSSSESYSLTDNLARPPPAPPLYVDVIVPYNQQVALCGGSNSMAYGYRKPDCVDYARPRARRNTRPAMTIPPLVIVKKGSNMVFSPCRASKLNGISAVPSPPSVKRKETTAHPSTLDSEIPNSILPFFDKDLPPAPLLLVDKAPASPSVGTADSSAPSPDMQQQESTCRHLSGVPKFRSVVPFVDEESFPSRPLLSVSGNAPRTRHLSMEIVKSLSRTAGKENIPPLIIVTSKRTSTPPLSVTKKKKKKNPATKTMALCDVTNTKKSWEVFRARGAIRKELGLPCLVRNDGEEILGTILE
ncbi:uncharacterized protein ARMOST_12578 [Armillaria ostoyae]|uniref:Uncharacterized protein n=1 Tax=Armillaria ostoyae TaxID=47428 RepID=A0A284RKC2_ARMOS|nr:uncharacterized protein ARMOST_12578 [Armillaria ostoyae]